jgi:transcriptional regulator with XRE-family HTH domain
MQKTKWGRTQRAALKKLAKHYDKQEDLARAMGVSQPTLSRWLSGGRPRNIDAALADLRNQSYIWDVS